MSTIFPTRNDTCMQKQDNKHPIVDWPLFGPLQPPQKISLVTSHITEYLASGIHPTVRRLTFPTCRFPDMDRRLHLVDADDVHLGFTDDLSSSTQVQTPLDRGYVVMTP